MPVEIDHGLKKIMPWGLGFVKIITGKIFIGAFSIAGGRKPLVNAVVANFTLFVDRDVAHLKIFVIRVLFDDSANRFFASLLRTAPLPHELYNQKATHSLQDLFTKSSGGCTPNFIVDE